MCVVALHFLNWLCFSKPHVTENISVQFFTTACCTMFFWSPYPTALVILKYPWQYVVFTSLCYVLLFGVEQVHGMEVWQKQDFPISCNWFTHFQIFNFKMPLYNKGWWWSMKSFLGMLWVMNNLVPPNLSQSTSDPLGSLVPMISADQSDCWILSSKTQLWAKSLLCREKNMIAHN